MIGWLLVFKVTRKVLLAEKGRILGGSISLVAFNNPMPGVARIGDIGHNSLNSIFLVYTFLFVVLYKSLLNFIFKSIYFLDMLTY